MTVNKVIHTDSQLQARLFRKAAHTVCLHLTDVLARINDYMITRLDELLPWNWKPLTPGAADNIAA